MANVLVVNKHFITYMYAFIDIRFLDLVLLMIIADVDNGVNVGVALKEVHRKTDHTHFPSTTVTNNIKIIL